MNHKSISQKVENAKIPCHFFLFKCKRYFFLTATVVLLTDNCLFNAKRAYYLFIFIGSWKLVQSFTRDPSILTCSFKIYSKSRMSYIFCVYWLKLFRTEGSHFKLRIKGRRMDAIFLFLSFSSLLASQSNENYLFIPIIVLKPPKQGFPV